MTEQAKWLLDWFQQRGSLPDSTPSNPLQIDYFKAGLIDSFGAIELITDVESHFDIRFDETHFQQRRFSTIGGLSELIAELSSSTEAREPAISER